MIEEEPFFNYDNLIDARRSYLQSLSTATGASSSTKAKSWQDVYASRKICCGKGDFKEQDEVLPIPLISEISAEIFETFDKDVVPSAEALQTARKVVQNMKPSFASEEERLVAFHTATNSFFNWTMSGKNSTGNYQIRKNYGPDGFVEVNVCGNEASKALICLVEVKHEIGSSKDPIVQVNLDYSKLAGQMCINEETQGHLPCVLLTLSGTLLTVQFGIVGKYVTICSLCDGFQFQGLDSALLLNASKLLTKIKNTLSILADYYQQGKWQNEGVPCSLPYLHTVKMYGQDVPIQYVKKIKVSTNSVVFEAKVIDEQSTFANCTLVVKFAKQYCASAHFLLANGSRHTRMAPALYSTVSINQGQWTALIMEKIEGCLTLDEVRKLPPSKKSLIIQDIAMAIQQLHENNVVHGDIRFPNVLVTKSLHVYLIDFEFSGEEEIATYPDDLDLGIFSWVDVEDLPHVLKKHDWAAFAAYSKLIRA